MTSKFHDILVTDQGNCHFHKKQLSYRILYYFVVFERQVIFLLPVINSFSANVPLTPRKHEKPGNFLFSGGLEVEHWLEMKQKLIAYNECVY